MAADLTRGRCQTHRHGEPSKLRGGVGGGGKALKRYGPIRLVVVIIAAVIAIAAGGGDDDETTRTTTGTTTGDNSDLPLTFQEAEDAGIEGDIEWGEGCDTERGRVAVPLRTRRPASSRGTRPRQRRRHRAKA